MSAGQLPPGVFFGLLTLRPRPADVVRVGDEVVWRGNFGSAPPAVTRVQSMEVTPGPREKYGEPATEVPWALVYANRVVFSLAAGSWAYAEQVRPYRDAPRVTVEVIGRVQP